MAQQWPEPGSKRANLSTELRFWLHQIPPPLRGQDRNPNPLCSRFSTPSIYFLGLKSPSVDETRKFNGKVTGVSKGVLLGILGRNPRVELMAVPLLSSGNRGPPCALQICLWV